MRLGIWTPLPHTIRPEPRMIEAVGHLGTTPPGIDTSYRFAAEVLQRAERWGFETTLVAARHLGPDLDAWTLASALAAGTNSIEIMVAVHPGIMLPQMVARMGASLDRISGGRFAVNVVNGWYRDEFDIFGTGGWAATPDERYRRMDEFVQVIKGLWTAEQLSFEGGCYRLQQASLPLKPLRQPHPPIYTASRSAEGKETIARHCDYWFVPDADNYRHYDATLALIRHEIAAMNGRARAHGRRIGYGLSAHVICTDTLEEATRRADAFEEYGRIARYNRSASVALGACLVGTPEIIADRLRSYEAAGVELFLFKFEPMLEGMEQFMTEVMPLIDRRPGLRAARGVDAG
jgi:FMNH2-dependent dimethyl sulfone monooxygenase